MVSLILYGTYVQENLFYRFRSDEKNQGPSAVETARCALMKGTLSKKGQLLWNDRFVALKADEGKLYYYDTETVCISCRM
jgi:hypothetical protein